MVGCRPETFIEHSTFTILWYDFRESRESYQKNTFDFRHSVDKGKSCPHLGVIIHRNDNAMKPAFALSTPTPRLRLVVLSLFVFCCILGSPKWMMPAAAWAAPVLFVWFVRNHSVNQVWVWGLPAQVVAGAISMYGLVPMPDAFFGVFIVVATIMGTLPYLLDRWLTPRLDGLVSTLVFPCVMTGWEYLNAYGSSGVWPSLANSQFGFSSLVQLASVTGVWGISFIVYWFASTVNRLISRPAEGKRGLLVYGVVLGAVLLYGAVRTAPVLRGAPETVRVAGITVDNLVCLEAMYADWFEKTLQLPPDASQSSPELREVQKAFGPFIKNPHHTQFRTTHRVLTQLHDSLFALSSREARGGARIILWSEGNAFVLKENESDLVKRGVAFTKAHHTYLLMSLAVILPGKITDKRKFLENKTVLIGPGGKVLNTYFKSIPVPGVEPSVPGDGRIPVIPTPYGNLSPAICYDADFPQLLRQTGQQGTDILLLPSGDWKAIAPFHSYIAVFRGIENGLSMVRQVNHGESLAADPYGNILASASFFGSTDKTLVAYVPTRRVPTLYNIIGDAFAYACILALVGFLMYALLYRKTAKGKVKQIA
jgi:apolipoprotein N-acyltransferase